MPDRRVAAGEATGPGTSAAGADAEGGIEQAVPANGLGIERVASGKPGSAL